MELVLISACVAALAEIGDRTQLLAIMLAMRFHNIVLVATGAISGMMLANVPVVFLGRAATRIVPLNVFRIGAAAVFAGLGSWAPVEAIRD
ncbi:MAG TPA: TMEM165/GDT1 family protein [Caulobacteraceae bacterium]|nr:TMEM165/GDT1 family protein [Caulobacteraceae bacterium]